jgi:hypothetical protein
MTVTLAIVVGLIIGLTVGVIVADGTPSALGGLPSLA